MSISKSFRFVLAVLYLAAVSVLFFLPGSAFPQTTWLDKIWFDKWVHVGLFAVLIVAWAWALQDQARVKVLVITAVLYGIFIEWVQHNFVANRGFDWTDWMADVAGTAVGWWIWNRYIKK